MSVIFLSFHIVPNLSDFRQCNENFEKCVDHFILFFIMNDNEDWSFQASKWFQKIICKRRIRIKEDF